MESTLLKLVMSIRRKVAKGEVDFCIEIMLFILECTTVVIAATRAHVGLFWLGYTISAPETQIIIVELRYLYFPVYKGPDIFLSKGRNWRNAGRIKVF